MLLVWSEFKPHASLFIKNTYPLWPARTGSDIAILMKYNAKTQKGKERLLNKCIITMGK